MTNEKLLQTNKRFSQLKLKQQEKIVNWLFDEYAKVYAEKMSEKDKNAIVLKKVYEKIEENEIWIPFLEVRKKYISKKNKI